jgi:aminopeptidase N
VCLTFYTIFITSNQVNYYLYASQLFYMKKTQFLFVCILAGIAAFAQPAPEKDESWKKIYRSSATKINDLVHTKLEVKFDYDKSYMYGKEWVTLKPHFYDTDSLTLDAKGMDIHKLALVRSGNNLPLKYEYDGLILKVHLDKTYKKDEKYTVYVDYTSKPNELKAEGSAAITDAKGLYFINPKGEEKDKPTEIWTQGETESNSAWFPTIDKPDQKSTDEIYMTVPDKYVTLSNGMLITQKKNGDGTRTDYWKMDLPHSPYLFMMAVGDFAIIKDHYKDKPVNYYVEKAYAPYAQKIFGNTPEMIAFYSKVLGIDYPWPKYSQIVVRDYVSGAMENTTATLHGEFLNKTNRDLLDDTYDFDEDVIAHELFHQWFGDLVTCESWSNLTVNESFADFSEMLWAEHKYGKDAADDHSYKAQQAYIGGAKEGDDYDLVRFHYASREDVFDGVTYQKGGRILNMLRNYVGDSAFFKALNLYLNTNKYKNGEAQQLRLAFEEITGQDLNWYWNQWYYNKGYPKLSIDYVYDNSAKNVKIIINQTQDSNNIFKLPIAIDIYNGAKKERHRVWVEDKTDTFTFAYNAKPDLVNVDGDKITLCEKKDNKTLENYIHQYKYAGLYLDRREAIDYCLKNQDDPQALDLLKTSMKDKFFQLRMYTIDKLDLKKDQVKQAVEPILADIAAQDVRTVVRASAITALGKYKKAEYKSLFAKAVNDSSFSVSGSALEALAAVDSNNAFNEAKRLSKSPARGKLNNSIAAVLIKYGDENDFDIITENFSKMPITQTKFNFLQTYSNLLAKVKNTDNLKRGVDEIVKFRDAIPSQARDNTDPYINNMILKNLATKKEAAGLSDQADYIKLKMSESKKGF